MDVADDYSDGVGQEDVEREKVTGNIFAIPHTRRLMRIARAHTVRNRRLQTEQHSYDDDDD